MTMSSGVARCRSRIRTILDNILAILRIIRYLVTNDTTHIKKALCSLPLDSSLSKILTGMRVATLWNSMLHPPLTYVGSQFRYRSATGKHNSILYPHIGEAGGAYALSVPGKQANKRVQPDPGHLFDLLLARKSTSESQSGISSLLLYHADLISHDVFRTNDFDKNLSDTSSYLELSPLYGKDQAAQDTVRTFCCGLLKPDTFAEDRLVSQPPGVNAMLIAYNRFHNNAATQLLEINEGGRFSKSPDKVWKRMSEAQKEEVNRRIDEDLFQTARLITCGLYIQISIHNYLRALMQLHTQNTAWTLDPRTDLSSVSGTSNVERGCGNQVSVEFNLLYRFHSPLSLRDTSWTEDFFERLFEPYLNTTDFTRADLKSGNIPIQVMRTALASLRRPNLTLEELKQAISAERKMTKSQLFEKYQEDEKDTQAYLKSQPYFPAGLEWLHTNPDGQVEYKFKRDEHGFFKDSDLVTEMVKVIEDPIHNFGAQNVPKILRTVEELSIGQARKWKVATLNEFRNFFGLPKHKSFEEINKDPEISANLRNLYGNPDDVELYPGLFCEGDRRNLDPGCDNANGETTLWRAIFSDAVTLVRGDRFYTTDWNASSLTNWGMREVSSKPSIHKGGVNHIIFQRAFPGHFNDNSIHLWEPFYTPAQNLIFAQEQGHLASMDLSDIDLNVLKSGLQDLIQEGQQETEYQAALESCMAQLSDDVDLRQFDWKKIGFKQLKNIVKRRANSSTESSRDLIVEDANEIHKIENSEIFVGAMSLLKDNIQKKPIDTLGKALAAALAGEGPRFMKASKHLSNRMENIGPDMFFKYLEETCENIRKAKQTTFEELTRKEFIGMTRTFSQPHGDLEAKEVFQIDVVKDFAAPVAIKCFIDFLNCWKHVRIDQDDVMQHVRNCHDIYSIDIDEVARAERRIEFTKSLDYLRKLAEKGIRDAQPYVFEDWRRDHGRDDDDNQHTRLFRKFGVETARTMVQEVGHDDTVAFMLKTALNMANRAVTIFTELLAPHVQQSAQRNGTTGDWQDCKVIQNLAFEDTLGANMSLMAEVKKSVEDHNLLTPRPMVHLPKHRDARITVKHSKGTSELVYGSFVHLNNAQLDDLTLYCISGMLKDIVTLSDLRVAPGRLGCLAKARIPGSRDGTIAGALRYLSAEADQLLPYPTTWTLRYDETTCGEASNGEKSRDVQNKGVGTDSQYNPTGNLAPGTDQLNSNFFLWI